MRTWAWLTAVVAAACLVSGQAHAQGARPSVGIAQMEDLANTGQAQVFSTMVETAIASTGRFRVIERSRLGKLLEEQGRAKSGLVTSRNGARVGGFEGVDFLIYGSMTTVTARAKTTLGSSLLGGMLSGLGGARGDVHCANQQVALAVDVRITDTDSGEIKRVTRITETQKANSVCGNGVALDVGALLRSAAEQVARTLVTIIYPIQVAALQGDGTVILNYGDGTLSPGTILTVFSKGRDIRDPTSGQVIGNEETKLGFLQVTEVSEKMSRAVVVGTSATPLVVGSTVRQSSAEDIRLIRAAAKSGKKRR